MPKTSRKDNSRRKRQDFRPSSGCIFRLSAALGVCFTLAAQLTTDAADILRGGGFTAPTRGSATGGAPAASTTQARANARDALARTSNALKSVRAMQATARDLAIKGPNNLGRNPNNPGLQLPNIPNGLVTGGLKVAPGVPVDLAHPTAAENIALWQGAKLPTQSTTASGRIKVTVEQTKPQALLTWETFNIGKETTLAFDQNAGGDSKSQWIAFNKIIDPTGVPSQILGSIQAPGQVYVINQNGIIFGGSSQINLHTLVASSLPINDNLISRGLLNNPDAQFLFSSLPIPAGTKGTPAFTPTPAPNGESGDVVVQPGAVIKSPTSAEHVGGRVALIAPNVTNAGTISTPDGQTILAAGEQVGFAAHASTDPHLRGLDVYVGAGGGTAANAANGLIEAPRADVTLIGKNVKQLGAIESSTSVSLNGRIDLLADYNAIGNVALDPNEPTSLPFLNQTAGTVTLGPGSVTLILPEYDSTETVVGAELALRSQANLRGKVVHFGADAELLAPNAEVNVSAGTWNYIPSLAVSKFVYSDGQIYLDAGAAINVAGSVDVSVPISKNIVSVQLLGSELSDSPLQRFGVFRGSTIQVDLRQTGIYNGRAWAGTPLGDTSGYIGLIQRSVAELTTAGGTVSLNAGGSVVIQDMATIDVSGGWISYLGGMVQTSKVITGGHIFDISQATPDRVYDGFNTGTSTTAHLKWGVFETFTAPLLGNGAHFEEGYDYGGNGGTVSITAPSMALDGKLLGHTITGPRQRVIAPILSTVSIAFQKQEGTTQILPVSPTPPKVVFQSNNNLAPADPFALDASGNPLSLRSDRVAKVILSPDLFSENGIGILKLDNGDGDVKVANDVTLAVSPGGSISFLGANIDIQGQVFAPGGSLSFTTFNDSPFSIDPATPPPDPSRGHFKLGIDAVLSTVGLVVDDRPIADAPGSMPLITTGGSVAIKSYNATLAPGSLVDVSGGVVVSASGKRTYGDGGKITIEAGVDSKREKLIGGHLDLGSDLVGLAGGRGGSLSIKAPSIQVGGRTNNADTLLLAPDFFSMGGFNSFALTGIGAQTGPGEYLPGVRIAPGTVIEPVVESLIADLDPNGGNAITLNSTVLPQGLRNPVNLSFTAQNTLNEAGTLISVRGDFVMGGGSVIRTDPKAVVSILSEGTSTVLGSIIAPGGVISITAGNNTNFLFGSDTGALPTVDLGPRSFLSTAGTTLLIPDPRGYHTGAVLSGGAITVSGNIVAEAGSRLDVSGASDTLDFLPAYSARNALLDSALSVAALVPTKVDSNGGVITLTGGQELFTDATLIGNAGGASAYGGSLIISSGRFYPTGGVSSPADVALQVTQGGTAIPKRFYDQGETAIGHAVLAADGTVAASLGHFAAQDFNRGGFDSLTLKGTVQFSGPVSIDANRSISVASSGVLYADSAVTLQAPYVALGQAFRAPVQPQQVVDPLFKSSDGAQKFIPPTYGSGRLTVIADLIDIGTLTLQGVGKASFIADNGDIRGNGTLDVAGSIYMRAGQIYPTTATSFNIIANDFEKGGVSHSGSVTFEASGSRPLAYSAGGQLSVYGSIINQGGVLWAPFGTINLGWDGVGTGPIDPVTGVAVARTQRLTLSQGSITSVSAIDPVSGQALVIPYGLNLNGTSWIDPMGTDITISGPPAKAINLSAATIADQAGSVVDIRGGGDLYAYRWVKGIGGSNDILASSGGFAIIPGYSADYAPYAPYNPDRRVGTDVVKNLGTDPGYVDGRLGVGDQVYLNASNGLAAGTYTLLPARYALLPGAFLVTPQSGVPLPSLALPDGSSLVSGYRFNDLSSARTETPLASRFEVASASVVRSRAEYADSLANVFLSQSALDHNLTPPRLPLDSGQLVLAATQAMAVQGSVVSQSVAGGRGGLVDISSPVDILIAGPRTKGGAGMLVLDARQLSAIGAESLLIGGVRQSSAAGTTVTVQTGNLTVDNAGTALSGNDIILVANKNLTVADNAVIEQTGGSAGQAETLLIGKANVAGSGDGVLLRVSSDPAAQILRSGVSSSNVPALAIGADALIAGASVILDSTFAMSLDPTARIDGDAIALNSGQISLQLDNPGTLQPTAGLVLSSRALDTLQTGAKALSLLSYSSIDIYGTGQVGQASVASLALHAAEIRGFNNDGGTAKFVAKNILLDNRANGTKLGPLAAAQGTLEFDANVIRLGAHQLDIDQYSNVVLNASGGLLAQGSGGLAVQQTLDITTPLITGAAGALHTFNAAGALSIQAPAGAASASISGGLGASLEFTGANVAVNSAIVLPSGKLTLRATGGDLQIGNLAAARLDVAGTAQSFFDLVKYTDGGQIGLISEHGNVDVAADSILNVAAHAEGGNAGTLSVDAHEGSFTVADGTMRGAGGAGGHAGSFSLDVGSLPSLQALDTALDAASLMQSRSIRVRNGDVLVDGTARAHDFNLSVDRGSILVSGEIDASGTQGGSIDLVASGSVTLASGSVLTVAAEKFSHAGKGGAILLEAGSETNGVINSSALLDIQAGSILDLSVAENSATSAEAGDFAGTLHLRAPQTTGSTDLQIAAINGTVLGASSIVAEGWQLFDLTSSGGAITSARQIEVKTNGTDFGLHTTAIANRLLAGNVGLASVLSIEAGAEIINRTGDLTLGTVNSTSASDWDLSTYRTGPNHAPGVLTLRAAGNLVFYNALSDGFGDGNGSIDYTDPLLDRNPLLPANVQSWSYRLAAGADFSAADFHRVQPLSLLASGRGSLQLGKDGGTNIANAPGRPPGANAQTRDAIAGHFQVIRTGTGDIDIATGRNVQLLNQFATIYTAGAKVTDPTLNGTFDLPVLNVPKSDLGAIQQSPFYPAQYSLGGGNVTIVAGNDIVHQTRDNAGNLIADSERELPVNWLYRRGYIDPTTGEFGIMKNGDVGSTTWWVDFSNFFEGVGALGGGDVTMIAGHDVTNVDGLVPTNARMPKIDPAASKLVELGGGDLVIRAGHNVDGGVYYVERGHGTLSAGNEITTNSTRSPSLTILTVPSSIQPRETWLPTTLFAGKASFDVSAGGDLTLGPVANPFLLPQGVNNTFWYKTYFSTYAPSNAINVSSLQGDVTVRQGSTLLTNESGMLRNWFDAELLFSASASGTAKASYYQPWLRLSETSLVPFGSNKLSFGGVMTLMPATLRATAFSGDINVVGKLTLSPSPTGTVDLAAAGSINGLQINGANAVAGGQVAFWGSGSINLSDADPNAIPGIVTPLSLSAPFPTGFGVGAWVATSDFVLDSVNRLFTESGSVVKEFGVIQTKQALHDSSLLHANDLAPIHLYAESGNISELTLFSGKSARVIAGNDITSVGLYVQNVSSADTTVVAAGRDIVAYDLNAPLRVAATAPGNLADLPPTGDIQISGPGTLEVMAGRNLDLGIGPNNSDGTGVGLTSIGNFRNPALPFEGADIIAGAGIGGSNGLAHSALDFENFIDQFLAPGTLNATRYLPELASLMNVSAAGEAEVWDAFQKLSDERKDSLALDIFYLVLRDSGRDHNLPGSPGFGTYTAGFEAISALFSSGDWQGDISLTSREIKTRSGGNINLFAPGGGLVVGIDVAGNQAADQGILTEHGGDISIFTDQSVAVGTSRIFTLRGGNELIWSSGGDIAAGASSKTVQTAPPTRVVIDPQSADVATDLAGLATGGGIGVLASIQGVAPGDVDLIAPGGTIDAGDAGIRVSGNINIAAVQVLNASNIQASGASSGVPTTSVSAPNISGLTNASNTAAAGNSTADEAAKAARTQATPQEEPPSIITVEVLGFGGGENGDDEEEKRRKAQTDQAQAALPLPGSAILAARK